MVKIGGGQHPFCSSKVLEVSLNGILLFPCGILAIYEGLVHFYRCVFFMKDNAADLFLFP